MNSIKIKMELASNTNPFLDNLDSSIDYIDLLMLNCEKEKEMEKLGIQGHTTVLLSMCIDEIHNRSAKQRYQKYKLQILINKTIPDQLESAEQMMQNMQIRPIVRQGNINYII